MKSIYTLCILSIVTLDLCSNELQWVDKQISAIKPAREGLKRSFIYTLRDPIIILKEPKKDENKTPILLNSTKVISSTNSIIPPTIVKKRVKSGLTLEAVINNSALINGVWYKLNDNVKGYKLSKINRTSIVLTRSGTSKTLSTRAKISTLKFKK